MQAHQHNQTNMDPINNTPNQAPINPNTSAIEPRNKGLFAGLIIVIVLLALGAIVLYAYSGARTMESIDYTNDNMTGNTVRNNNAADGSDTSTPNTNNTEAEEINSIEAEVQALEKAELE